MKLTCKGSFSASLTSGSYTESLIPKVSVYVGTFSPNFSCGGAGAVLILIDFCLRTSTPLYCSITKDLVRKGYLLERSVELVAVLYSFAFVATSTAVVWPVVEAPAREVETVSHAEV